MLYVPGPPSSLSQRSQVWFVATAGLLGPNFGQITNYPEWTFRGFPHITTVSSNIPTLLNKTLRGVAVHKGYERYEVKAPAPLSPPPPPDTRWTESWAGSRAGVDMVANRHSCDFVGNRTPVVQHADSHFTGKAVPTHSAVTSSSAYWYGPHVFNVFNRILTTKCDETNIERIL